MLMLFPSSLFSVPLCAMIGIPVAEDYSVGFGGKFGVQKDRQDKSALGWDHQEEVQPHASQTGTDGPGADCSHCQNPNAAYCGCVGSWGAL